MGEYTNVAKQLFLLTTADCQPVLVFLPCSHSAPDMALRFVQIQDHSGLGGKRWIDRDKSLRAVLMFRRDELERFRPSPNLQANAGKYPHSHPYPLRFSG